MQFNSAFSCLFPLSAPEDSIGWRMGWVGAPGLWTKCMTARGSFGNRFLVNVGCGGVIEYGSILLYLFGEGQFV